MSNRCGQVGSHCVSYRTGLAPASKGQLGSFPGVPGRFPPRLWIWERIALVFPNILYGSKGYISYWVRVSGDPFI